MRLHISIKGCVLWLVYQSVGWWRIFFLNDAKVAKTGKGKGKVVETHSNATLGNFGQLCVTQGISEETSIGQLLALLILKSCFGSLGRDKIKLGRQTIDASSSDFSVMFSDFSAKSSDFSALISI